MKFIAASLLLSALFVAQASDDGADSSSAFVDGRALQMKSKSTKSPKACPSNCVGPPGAAGPTQTLQVQQVGLNVYCKQGENCFADLACPSGSKVVAGSFSLRYCTETFTTAGSTADCLGNSGPECSMLVGATKPNAGDCTGSFKDIDKGGFPAYQVRQDVIADPGGTGNRYLARVRFLGTGGADSPLGAPVKTGQLALTAQATCLSLN